MKNLERISTDIERNLKNVEYAFRFHLVIFITSTIVFVFFGIIPLVTVLKTKYVLYNEMKDRYSVLESNLSKLQAAEILLEENSTAISYLDQYMPEETSVQNYILDFVNVASNTGYSVNGFVQDYSSNPTGTKNAQHDLIVYMEGSGYPTDVIKKIEKLKRVTQIKTFTLIINKKEISTLNLVLSIFNYIL